MKLRQQRNKNNTQGNNADEVLRTMTLNSTATTHALVLSFRPIRINLKFKDIHLYTSDTNPRILQAKLGSKLGSYILFTRLDFMLMALRASFVPFGPA